VARPSWQILVASIEHRHAKLERLLDCLGPQIVPGVTVLVYRDNLEAFIGAKRQALLEAATADYISFIDDDDTVAPDYVAAVTKALGKRPDYVGWEQVYLIDGVSQGRVIHSLANGPAWHNENGIYYRGIAHTNVVRRDLALLARFDTVSDGHPGEDYNWIMALAATGMVQTEAYIDEKLYTIQGTSIDNFHTRREPLTEHPPRLERKSVRYVHAGA
jgi:glycosyltransferase involved in cell wall biosynthesis